MATTLGLGAAIAACIALPVLGQEMGVAAALGLIGAFVFSLLHPLVPFALYFSVLFFKDTTFGGALPISLNQVLAPLFFLSTFLYYLRGKTMPVRFSLLPLLSVVCLYFLIRAVTGEDFENGLLYGRYVIIYLILSVCVAILMSTERTILTLAWIIVGLTTVAAMHGYYEAYEKNLFGGFTGSWGIKHRVAGTAPNPIVFAWNLLYAFPFAFLLFAESASRYTRILALLLGTAILGAATMTFNRQTYVLMLVMIAMSSFLYVYRNRKLLLTLLATFGGLLSFTVMPVIVRRLFTVTRLTNDFSFLERRDSYLIGMEMISSSPIFGIGFGSYPKVWHKYIPADYSTYFAQYRGAQNDKFMDMNYLYLLSETGIVGVALFITLLIIIFRKAWRYRKMAKVAGDHFAQNLASTVLVITAFIGLTSMIQDTFLYTRIWVFYGIAMLLDPRVLPVQIAADEPDAEPAPAP